MIEALERIGFQNLHARRLGPCQKCTEILLTFYIPELKEWYCETCFYSSDDNREFIRYVDILMNENTMAQAPTPQEMWAEIQRLRTENRQFKATREDNVFVGGTDNLTLKNRQLNPRAWGVPTKDQNGQTYFRCSDFPMTFDIAPDKKSVRVYTAIPASPEEVELFQQRFISQGIVVAKRRQPKEASEAKAATTQAFSPPAAPSPVQAPPAKPTTISFSTLQPAEQQSLIAEANKLMSIPGLFKDLQTALNSVIQPKNISLP